MAYGNALRQRVLTLYDQGLRTRPIAKQLLVSESWCRRVKQRRAEPARKIGGRACKLDETARTQLAQWVEQRPDATLAELRQRILKELGIRISVGALWNSLRLLKLSLKKSRSSPASNSAPMWPKHAMSSFPGNSKILRYRTSS